MKWRAGVTEALLSSTECPEILSGLGNDVRTKLHDDTTRWFVTDGNVEVALWVWPTGRGRDKNTKKNEWKWRLDVQNSFTLKPIQIKQGELQWTHIV